MANINTNSDCFVEVEHNLNIEIPATLKNVLRLNGFNNEFLLAKLSEHDVTEIEKFMINRAPFLISYGDYESYYGVFCKNPKKFQFLPSQKKMLRVISDYFKHSSRNQYHVTVNPETVHQRIVEQKGKENTVDFFNFWVLFTALCCQFLMQMTTEAIFCILHWIHLAFTFLSKFLWLIHQPLVFSRGSRQSARPVNPLNIKRLIPNIVIAPVPHLRYPYVGRLNWCKLGFTVGNKGVKNLKHLS